MNKSADEVRAERTAATAVYNLEREWVAKVRTAQSILEKLLQNVESRKERFALESAPTSPRDVLERLRAGTRAVFNTHSQEEYEVQELLEICSALVKMFPKLSGSTHISGAVLRTKHLIVFETKEEEDAARREYVERANRKRKRVIRKAKIKGTP